MQIAIPILPLYKNTLHKSVNIYLPVALNLFFFPIEQTNKNTLQSVDFCYVLEFVFMPKFESEIQENFCRHLEISGFVISLLFHFFSNPVWFTQNCE